MSTKSVSSTDPHDVEDSGSMDDADDSECYNFNENTAGRKRKCTNNVAKIVENKKKHLQKPLTPFNTPQAHASNMGPTLSHHPYRFNGNIHHANNTHPKTFSTGFTAPGPSGDRFSQMLFSEENYRDL